MDKLLKAQLEIGAIKKESNNPFFHSKYFDINAILAEVKPILNKHGLVVLQPLNIIEGKNGLTTLVVDADTAEVISQSNCFLPEGLDPQKTGSAITYFRRYALQSLLALEAEDDDGNGASGNDKKSKYPAYPVNDNLNAFMKDLEPTDEEVIQWIEKLESAKDLKELKKFAETVPGMVKDKIGKVKFEEIKNKIK